MKKTTIVICAATALIFIFAVGAWWMYKFNFTNSNNRVACAQEAKICPDGSAVARISPDCEFASCPESTSAFVPSEISAAEIQQLFAAKYPKYARTVTVRVDKETQNHARGGVIFVPGAPGGIFLVAKIDGQWQLVFDGNGQIPCALSKYGFPADMLADCF